MEAKTIVTLNVYELPEKAWLNIFHTGVEVYGDEYAFCGHQSEESGIYKCIPGTQYFWKFRETIILGETDYEPEEVETLVDTLGEVDFQGNKYHLLTNNCNHFSEIVAMSLTGKEIPTWINRPAKIITKIPFWSKIIPSKWCKPLQETDSSQSSFAES